MLRSHFLGMVVEPLNGGLTMTAMKNSAASLWLGVLLALGVGAGGCSSFHHDAKVARSAVAKPEGPEGVWVGQWQDGKRTSHGGELECVLTRTGAQLYRFSTHSHWWRWFTSSLDMMVVVTPSGPGRYEIRGEREIWPLGDYRLEGRIDGTNFVATYDAGGTRGKVQLNRP